MKDYEESRSPLLAEAGSSEDHDINYKREESSEFFFNQQANFALSAVLILICYSAILVPAYFPAMQANWPDSSTDESMALMKHSAALLSQPCKSGWTKTSLQKVATFHSLLQIPVFIQNETEQWEMAPPLGLRGSEELLAQTLQVLPQYGLPSAGKRCTRCMVVGSGGVLHGKQLGAHIDKHDIVIRMNNAPVLGFEIDAGSKTTIRLMYPEGAPYLEEEYQNTDILALVVFKRLDLEWLSSIVTKKPLSWWSKLWFWRDVVNAIPLEPGSFRILNTEVLNRTWHVLQSYTKKREILPTLGISGVVLALQLCDEVSLAGFGYDLDHPGARLHYYETVRMDHMTAQVVHDVSAEGSLLRELVTAGVVHDVTGAL